MTRSVFKYRGLSALDRDLTTLAADRLYAPTAAYLNDPTEVVLNHQVVQMSAEAMSPEVARHYETLVEMRCTVGIFSLSKVCNDELMWAHYADSHAGYCIEYDLDRLVLEARTQWDTVLLEYSDEPPSLDFSDVVGSETHEKALQKMLGHKSSRWAYEDELRIVTARSGVNHCARAAVKAIYFGCRCSDADRLKIRSKMKNRNIQYNEMYFPEISYKLDSRMLDRLPEIDGEAIETVAPIEMEAISKPEHMGGQAHLYPQLVDAVEYVRKDPNCVKIVYAGASASGPHSGKLFVQFESSVPTDLSPVVNWYFNPVS